MQVAAVQLNACNDMQENWLKICQYVQQACARKAQLVLLPEVCMGIGHRHAKAKTFTYDTIIEKLSLLAQQQQVCIIAGSIKKPIPHHKKSWANTVVFSAAGEVICEYQKIHLFDANIDDALACYRESDDYNFGEQAKTFTFSGVTIGLSICYDLRFSELFSILRARHAQLIVVPAAFTHKTGQAHWLTLLKARAIEFGVYILAANQTGHHDSQRRSFGHSCLIDPWGNLVSMLQEDEGIVCGEMDLSYLQAVRDALPSFDHRRPIR